MPSKSIKRNNKKRTNTKTVRKISKKRTLKGGNPAKDEGFCVKCRAKRIMTNVRLVTNKRGYPMKKGNCPRCGTKMGRFMKRN